MFGLQFFQELTEEEWAIKSKKVFVLNEQIKTEKALVEFMVKEQMTDDFTDTMYKIYFFPQMCKGRSALFLKTHHCFTDGLGLATFFLALSGEYDANALPCVKPLPMLK